MPTETRRHPTYFAGPGAQTQKTDNVFEQASDDKLGELEISSSSCCVCTFQAGTCLASSAAAAALDIHQVQGFMT